MEVSFHSISGSFVGSTVASVLLLSASPKDDKHIYGQTCYAKLRECADKDAYGVHSLTDDARAADLIIFVESRGAGLYFEEVRRHRFVKQYRDKCFLFCEIDWVIPFLPGIYASIEKQWFDNQRTRSGHYLRNLGQSVPYSPDLAQPYLYSFVGSAKTSGVRDRLIKLSHPRGLVLDTTHAKEMVSEGAATKQQYRRQYFEISRSSKFILCPRGLGASSMRLFESMRMGRAPVIISDQWVPPTGPLWERFSLHVAERDIDDIPSILEKHEAAAQQMGFLARTTWEEWFSEEASFHRVVEWCLDIQDSRVLPERIKRYVVYAQLLRPFHFRRFIRTRLQLSRRLNRHKRPV